MFSDYVRLTVQGICHLLSSECYQTKWIPLVLERVPTADSQAPMPTRVPQADKFEQSG